MRRLACLSHPSMLLVIDWSQNNHQQSQKAWEKPAHDPLTNEAILVL